MEKIKTWLFFNKENLIGFFKYFIPTLILIFVVSRIPWILDQLALGNYDSETMGVVTYAKKIKGISDSQTGGRVVTKFFHIEYEFKLEGNVFEKKEKIPTTTINVKQYAKLNKIEIGDSILVKYDSENHDKSKIKIE